MIEQVVVVRHAEREDTVNEDWVYTSPTSYDPPLSAKGCEQATAVAEELNGSFR